MLELNKIYNEDCLETMKKIDDSSVDLIITSPPYNKAGFEGFIRKISKHDTWKSRNIMYGDDAFSDFMKEDDYQNEQIQVLNECQRILNSDGSLFYNHKVRVAQHKASHPIEWILKSNLIFRQQITWDRKSSPNVDHCRYLPSTELIFWLTKTQVQPNFERNINSIFKFEVWTLAPKPNKYHPAPYPIEIPRNIMMSLKNKENIVVYDPYTGSGTTLIAAKEFGFDYIGSEKIEKYVKYANRQLTSALF